MKEPHIIIINGLSRGGTNIVWNILQSHPNVCSPIYETGKIFNMYAYPRFNRIAHTVLTHPYLYKTSLGKYFYNHFEECLHELKMQNYGHIENGEKYDGVSYSKEEVLNAVLCLKGPDKSIFLTPAIQHWCQNTIFIGLIRNGYAWCNGWIRRGYSAAEAGLAYKEIGVRILRIAATSKISRIIKFEDVLNDPFGLATQLYKTAGLEPVHLDKLRLKSKKILQEKGHIEKYGEEGKKYWFDLENIGSILDKEIDKRQASLLTVKDRMIFEEYAGSLLEEFEYKAIC